MDIKNITIAVLSLMLFGVFIASNMPEKKELVVNNSPEIQDVLSTEEYPLLQNQEVAISRGDIWKSENFDTDHMTEEEMVALFESLWGPSEEDDFNEDVFFNDLDENTFPDEAVKQDSLQEEGGNNQKERSEKTTRTPVLTASILHLENATINSQKKENIAKPLKRSEAGKEKKHTADQEELSFPPLEVRTTTGIQPETLLPQQKEELVSPESNTLHLLPDDFKDQLQETHPPDIVPAQVSDAKQPPPQKDIQKPLMSQERSQESGSPESKEDEALFQYKNGTYRGYGAYKSGNHGEQIGVEIVISNDIVESFHIILSGSTQKEKELQKQFETDIISYVLNQYLLNIPRFTALDSDSAVPLGFYRAIESVRAQAKNELF